MRILVTLAAHYVRGPDDRVYTAGPHGIDHAFWTNYLSVFDQVVVAARVAQASAPPPEGAAVASGPGVEFHDLPDYVGSWQYARCRGLLTQRLREVIPRYDAYCLRVACPIGTLACRELRRRGLPFGVEVVADPWDALARGSVKDLLRPVARLSVARDLKHQCRTAASTAYVTREALQRRYPPAPGAFTTHYSSIELPNEAVAAAPRPFDRPARRLIFVGTLAVLYKAPDVLIRALALTARPDLHLTIIGDGRERPGLEELARSSRVAHQISFRGRLPSGKPVRDALDAADVFIGASRQEGLPRAMIEAMARGLPCIGSMVGGIPELLEPRDLVPADDVRALAGKIVEVVDDPVRLQRTSVRNLQQANDYLADKLAVRRRQFYETLRKAGCSGG